MSSAYPNRRCCTVRLRSDQFLHCDKYAVFSIDLTLSETPCVLANLTFWLSYSVMLQLPITPLQRDSQLHNLSSHSRSCYVYYMTPPSHKSPHNSAGLQHSIGFGVGETLPIGSTGSEEFGWPILNATNKRLDQSSLFFVVCLFVN